MKFDKLAISLIGLTFVYLLAQVVRWAMDMAEPVGTALQGP